MPTAVYYFFNAGYHFACPCATIFWLCFTGTYVKFFSRRIVWLCSVAIHLLIYYVLVCLVLPQNYVSSFSTCWYRQWSKYHTYIHNNKRMNANSRQTSPLVCHSPTTTTCSGVGGWHLLSRLCENKSFSVFTICICMIRLNYFSTFTAICHSD